MLITDSLKVRIEGQDYKELTDKFIIYNVPIMAELVQPYDDGLAFKPNKEIQKVSVDNIPLTMESDNPDHPPHHLSEGDTDFKADHTVGYMSNPSRPKLDANPRKKYADFILYKNRLTETVMDVYKNGGYIDTSIGFKFEKNNQSGTHDGVKYDYSQTNIILDHNAILMDQYGNIGTGRMPSPIGGIGADKQDDEVARMSNEIELQKQIQTLTAERDDALKKLKEHNDSLIKQQTDKMQKSVDSLQAENDKIKADLKAKADELTKVSDELKVFKDKEKEAIDKMRDELKKANPKVDKLFDAASDDIIKEYHDNLLKELQNSHSRNIGADMMGSKGREGKNENDRINQWLGKDKKNGGDQ